MAIFDSSVALALSLITKYGSAFELRSLDNAVDDTDTPWKVHQQLPPRTQDVNAIGVQLEAEKSLVDGSSILEGHKVVLVPAAGVDLVPKALDLVVYTVDDEETVWVVSVVKTLAPNGQMILHELQVRQ